MSLFGRCSLSVPTPGRKESAVAMIVVDAHRCGVVYAECRSRTSCRSECKLNVAGDARRTPCRGRGEVKIVTLLSLSFSLCATTALTLCCVCKSGCSGDNDKTATTTAMWAMQHACACADADASWRKTQEQNPFLNNIFQAKCKVTGRRCQKENNTETNTFPYHRPFMLSKTRFAPAAEPCSIE